MLCKRDAVHPKPAADIHHLFAAHPVRIKRVIPAAVGEFPARGDVQPRLFPFRQQRLVREFQQSRRFLRSRGRCRHFHPFLSQCFVRFLPCRAVAFGRQSVLTKVLQLLNSVYQPHPIGCAEPRGFLGSPQTSPQDKQRSSRRPPQDLNSTFRSTRLPKIETRCNTSPPGTPRSLWPRNPMAWYAHLEPPPKARGAVDV